MAVFCDTCRQQKGWRKPALRTSRKPCDFCGDYDAIRVRKIVNGEPKVTKKKLDNFSQSDDMLVGTAAETSVQDPISEMEK